MFRPVKIADLDLSEPLSTLSGLHGYGHVRALVRWHGVPLGEMTLSVESACIEPDALAAAIARELGPRVMSTLVSAALERGPLNAPLSLPELLEERPAPPPRQLPRLSVAVCTRDRPDDLRDCLNAIKRQVVPPHEVVVVDNASSSDQTRLLVQRDFPSIRYVHEPRPGLDWARNRAIAETSGDVLAFTDDDVLVDGRWTAAIAAAFAERPEIDALTGLVLPAEIETEAQWLFSGMADSDADSSGESFTSRRSRRRPPQERHVGTGKFGTGANMAFRRLLFERIGGFDPALDVGTPTNGGGDLELFFRVVAEGATLFYEPHAIVRHRHRRSRHALRRQISGNGVGFYSHLVRTASVYPRHGAPWCSSVCGGCGGGISGARSRRCSSAIGCRCLSTSPDLLIVDRAVALPAGREIEPGCRAQPPASAGCSAAEAFVSTAGRSARRTHRCSDDRHRRANPAADRHLWLSVREALRVSARRAAGLRRGPHRGTPDERR